MAARAAASVPAAPARPHRPPTSAAASVSAAFSRPTFAAGSVEAAATLVSSAWFRGDAPLDERRELRCDRSPAVVKAELDVPVPVAAALVHDISGVVGAAGGVGKRDDRAHEGLRRWAPTAG